MNEQYFTSLNGYYVKDKEAIHTYDSVAEMKADSKIKEGAYVKTLGYYEVNDGGYAEYKIVDDSTLTDDGGCIHTLTNGLKAKLIINGEINVKQFGAYCDNTNDDTNLINNAIKVLAKNGGGILRGCPGTISKINGTIWLIDNITYQFDNYELYGIGTNTLFESGYYDSTDDALKRNYDPEAQYDGTYFPENRLNNMKLLNATISNCNIGIKALCLNQRCVIQGCKFSRNIQNFSVDISFSWGFKFLNNVVLKTASFTEFADWTLIESNSFEGAQGEDEKLLIVGKGSYSCKIMSNGFHHANKCIELCSTLRNTEISNNHFESFDYGIYQDVENVELINIYIHNNWFWSYKDTSVGIYARSLKNSLIEFNTFYDAQHAFASYVDIEGTEVYSNTIRDFSANNNSNYNSNFNINNGTIIEFINGRNDNLAHPQIEYFTKDYTAEKYVAKYNNRTNTIPLCTLSHTNDGHILNVRTFVDYDDNYGVQQPVLFSIYDTPSSGVKTHLCGIVMGKTVTFFTNQQVNNNYEIQTSVITAETSNYNGKLAILFNAHNGYLTQPTGIIKAL